MEKQKNIWWIPFRLTMTLAGFLAILTVFAYLGETQVVRANSGDFSNLTVKYPNLVGTSLQTCTFCHTASIPSLNPYGTTYKNNGRSLAAFGLSESTDSDKDGFTNIQEIMALTFPGDPLSVPVPTATPTNTAVPPTNTPLPPTPTNTAVPPTPTNTSVPPTNTAVPPTPTNTVVPPTPTNTSVAPTPTNTTQPPMPTNTPEGPKPTETPEPPEPTDTPEPTIAPTDDGTFDIDIREFSVSEEAKVGKGKPVYIKVNIRNTSKIEGMGSATVIGVQNGVEIYRQTLPIAMDAEGRSRWFTFMSYTPLQKGKIIWTVTLQDNDPDTDLKTAVTKVEGKDDDDDDHHRSDDDHD